MDRIKHSELLWQYAVISMHNAIQGYISAGLRNRNLFVTWKDSQTKKWQSKFDLNNQGIESIDIPQLDNFLSLYDKAFPAESSIDRGLIEFLNGLRNEFIHFNTDHFSTDIDSLISACNEGIKILKRVPHVFHDIFVDEEQRSEFENLVLRADEKVSMQKKT